MKVVITGGVLTPAISIIEKLKSKKDSEIFYFGTKYSMEGDKTPSVESKLIPSLGVNFYPINAGRLQRRFTSHTIPALLKIPIGFFQSLMLLNKIKPDVICSFGGYLSVPVVIAGWLLKIPILTHEQTVVFGLASKINSIFADKVAVSFEQSMPYFPKSKVILTGNPIREDIFKNRMPLWYKIKENKKPLIYITGGNQGSHVINEAVVEIIEELLKKYIVVQQTGEKDFEFVSKVKDKLGENFKENYFLFPYLKSEEIGWVLNQADLVISRAGANTVCELAALGKIAILIPIPWASQNEQYKNAEMLAKIGTAEILSQDDLNGKFLKTKIENIFSQFEKYKKGVKESKKLINNDAAEKIISEVYKIQKGK